MLFPALQLSPGESQDPTYLEPTFRHSPPTPKKTGQKQTSVGRRLNNLSEGLLFSVIATAIKPLIIWKLALANTLNSGQ